MKEAYKESLIKEAEALSSQYNVLAVMCYGSQNYHLDVEGSDFDTKAIIVPSFEDLVKGEKISKTIDFGCGVCDVKDIRLYIENLKKQNVNYIETLFTDYIIVNPRYQHAFDQLLDKKEAIATYNKVLSLDAMYGMLIQQIKKLQTSCAEGNAPSANKCYVNVFKFALMADKYTKGMSYRDVLDCSKLRSLRENTIPLDKMQAHAEHLKEKTRSAIDDWKASEVHIADTDTESFLDTWLLELLKEEFHSKEDPSPKEQDEKMPQQVTEDMSQQINEESKESDGKKPKSLIKIIRRKRKKGKKSEEEKS